MENLTVDPYSDNYIRRTDNSLKEGDVQGSPQVPRPLTQEEIDSILEVYENGNS